MNKKIAAISGIRDLPPGVDFWKLVAVRGGPDESKRNQAVSNDAYPSSHVSRVPTVASPQRPPTMRTGRALLL
jgi:hypothetical protein